MSSNMHLGFKLVLLFTLCAQWSCTNALSSFAAKDDDQSLLYEAKESIRKGDYSTAIASCLDMSSSFYAQSDVAMVCASAYAGRCGFTTMGVINRVDTYVSSAPPEKLFHWYMTQITGTTAQSISDCNTAIQIMNAQGTAANRTTDQNGFVSLLALHAISVVLNETGDVTDDNVLDGGFDACAISAANSQVIGLAFWELNKSTTQLASNPYYTNINTAVSTICGLMSSEGQDLCASTTPLALSANELKGARSLILEGAAVGVDQCTGGMPISAGCKCP